MEIKEIEHGVHPDGVQWRIRQVGEYYYYSELIFNRDGIFSGWNWYTNYLHINLENVRNKVASDSRAKEAYIKYHRKANENV